MLFLKWAAGSLSCLETTMNRGELLCVCVSLSVCWHWKEGAMANLNQTMLMSRCSLICSHIHHTDSYTSDPTLTVHQFNWLFLYSSSSPLFLSPPSLFPPQEKGTQQTSSFCFSHFPVEVNMWKPLCCECVKTLRNRSLRPRRCKLFISLTRILETTRQTYPRTQTCHFTYWHIHTHTLRSV